jgi:hypothetical protein
MPFLAALLGRWAPIAHLALFWLAFNALHGLLRTVFARRFKTTLERCGVTLERCGVQVRTTRADRVCAAVATRAAGFWEPWFATGAVVSVVLMALGILLLLFNGAQLVVALLTARSLSGPPSGGNGHPPPGTAPVANTSAASRAAAASEDGGGTLLLTPLLPGVNLPIEHTVYLLLTLAINAFWHELGHALAASCARVRASVCVSPWIFTHAHAITHTISALL